jgi:hypothetical protein
MLSQQDLQQIAQKGISEQQIETQLGQFKTGFPFLRLKAAASIEDGIVATNEHDKEVYIDVWNE